MPLQVCATELWHEACCPALSCGPQGKVPYRGACWCECGESLVGAVCDGRAIHVTVAMTISGLTIQRFYEKGFLRALAAAAGVAEDRTEMGRLVQLSGERRRKGARKSERAIEGGGNRTEARVGKRGRRAVTGVEAGARVLAASTEEAVRVAKWLNGEGGDVWREGMVSVVRSGGGSTRVQPVQVASLLSCGCISVGSGSDVRRVSCPD